MSLEDEYEQACWEACTEADKRGYGAPWWKSMIRAHGAVQASIKLIRSGGGDPQSGFKRLVKMGMVNQTVEYAVLLPKWRPLFAPYPDVLEAARWILQQADVEPPDEDEDDDDINVVAARVVREATAERPDPAADKASDDEGA